MPVIPVEHDDQPKTYDFVCPEESGCGGEDGPFKSIGWSRRKDAVERGRQHAAEHEAGRTYGTLRGILTMSPHDIEKVRMPELVDFRREQGI